MGFGTQLIYALLLGAPVACIAWTVTREEVFKELRDALNRYQKRHDGCLWRQKLAYLPTCPYCFSHYVAALMVGLFQFKMLSDGWEGYVASFFTVVLVANVYLSAYSLLRVALRRATAIAEREEANARCQKRFAAAVDTLEPGQWNSAAMREGPGFILPPRGPQFGQVGEHNGSSACEAAGRELR